jgi:uncharacterized protein (DUF433 family)
MDENKLLERITVNPKIFGGKPIIRGRRLAVEHVLGMLAAGDTPETILQGYPWLEQDDIKACLIYARRLVGHERVEPLLLETGTWNSSLTHVYRAVSAENYNLKAMTPFGLAIGPRIPVTMKYWKELIGRAGSS